MSAPRVLDATAGGRSIWHKDNKDPDGVLFSDMRHLPPGSSEYQPGWSCEPDVLADNRQLPYKDGSFDLIAYDPPHRVDEDGMEHLAGNIEIKYGALQAETWQANIRESFRELWRVLAPGGTLTFKWADVHKSQDEVLAQIDQTPLYGVSRAKKKGKVSWWVYHKHAN